MEMVHFPVILLVEDDLYTLRSLAVNLEADGFEVLSASSGKEALQQIEHKLPDLVVVDLLLPDMHGFDVCQKIKSYLDVPIIILSAVGAEDHIVKGIRLYAEDYVVKPFNYGELTARIHRVLKRTSAALPSQQDLVVNEHLHLNFGKHLAVVDDKDIRLTPVESRILATLARNANQAVSAEVLMDEVWSDGEGDTGRLWVNVCRLRRKLETDPDQPRALLTERGLGYKLVIGR